MKTVARWAPLCALVWMVAAAPAFGQGAYNKALFETAMEDAMKTTRVLLGALIGGDWGKAQTEAASLAGHAKKIRGLTPKVGADDIAGFQAHADSLGSRATRLVGAAKAHDAGRAAALYGSAISSCMDCHRVFRK